MKILGIDPGTRVLGYGMVDDSVRPARVLESGTLEASPRAERPERLRVIGGQLRELLERLQPDVVAIEKAFYGRNAATLITLGEGRGVVLFLAAECGAAIFEYSPAEVKKSVTGLGSARKEQVAEMVRAMLDGAPPDGKLDETDALAIATCHAHRRHAVDHAAAAGTSVDARLRGITGGRVRRGRGR